MSSGSEWDAATAIAYLQSPQAIRDRCTVLFDLACADKLTHFRCDLEKLDATAAYVLEVIRDQYPDLDVPFHSRWRHFEGDGSDRLQTFYAGLAGASPIERARSQVDLAVTSVLLDAGAGAQWQFCEPGTQQMWQRSEGLAIASLYLFQAGAFSSQMASPFQADASGLRAFSQEELCQGFQVSDRNPLVGVGGRVQLLNQLGRAIAQNPGLFPGTLPRPGNLVDYLVTQATDGKLAATTVFRAVMEGFGSIWPGRVAIAGVNLGDVWPHSSLPDTGIGSQLVPLHKLSQWLTYSLLEPLQDLGLTITDLDQLTGLAEYRNGGLCVDMGLLQPKHDGVLGDRHLPSSEVIVEWRALTVVLLDRIAAALRAQLGQDETQLPLVKVLEGGTWTAGRRLAQAKRGGLPPIQIDSDGTVF
ncbi:MAG: URC4/urg3 family protein [Synechococcales cyanobacterium T60_A2020_003]|nr:URC4/urg3 family protein [Synechococcales cyanobacterium T60_A2020_003]